jgi:hypothetical protein
MRRGGCLRDAGFADGSELQSLTEWQKGLGGWAVRAAWQVLRLRAARSAQDDDLEELAEELFEEVGGDGGAVLCCRADVVDGAGLGGEGGAGVGDERGEGRG